MRIRLHRNEEGGGGNGVDPNGSAGVPGLGDGGNGSSGQSTESRTIDIPEFASAAEFSKWFHDLDEEAQKSFRDFQAQTGLEIPEEKSQEGKKEESSALPFGVSKDDWDKLSEAAQKQLKETFESKKKYLDVKPEDEEFSQKIAADPFVQFRALQLKGEIKDLGLEDLKGMFAPEKLKEALDFDSDPDKAYAKLSQMIDTALVGVMNSQTEAFNQKMEQEKYQAQAKAELDDIAKTFDPTQEEIDAFFDWYKDSGVDIVKLKGKPLYQLYLVSTGKSQDVINAAMQKGAQKALDSLSKATEKTPTLGKSTANGQSEPTIAGIDANRLRKDPAYAAALMREYAHNPTMKARLYELANKKE